MTYTEPDIELPVGTCRDCGKTFRLSRNDRVFCSHRCNRNFWSRCQKRGGVLYPMLVKWRKSRGKDRSATLSDICAILDNQIAEDQAAGRVLVCDVPWAKR